MFNCLLNDNLEAYTALVMAIYILSALCLGWIIYIVIKAKRSEQKISKRSWVGIVISLFIMWQSVPPIFGMLANYTSDKEKDFYSPRAIAYYKIAAGTSIFPAQKGWYYTRLAMHNKDVKNQVYYLNKAYSYIKSYKYPCWILFDIAYYKNGDYDKAIEIAKEAVSKDKKIDPKFKRPRYIHVAKCYIMKGDFEKAMVSINKELDVNKTTKTAYLNALCLKSYLEYKRGNTNSGEKYYNEAEKIFNDTTKYDSVTKTYKKLADIETFEVFYNKKYSDFYAYEKNRLKELKAKSVE